MVDERTEVKEKQEEVTNLSPYDLHVQIPREMQTKLKDATELAYELGDIPKPDLVNLMNLFIGWGLSVQKRKWLARMDYR